MFGQKAVTYYVPECQEKNRFYFASKAKYLVTTPVQIPDFSLWAILDNLDTISTPYTVIATRSKGSISYMYPIVFSDDIQEPDFNLLFVAQESGRNILFIPNDRFLQLDVTKTCVPIPNNYWEPNSFRFHVIAAFHRLNIIPSLCISIFARDDLFNEMSSKFFHIYSKNGQLPAVLASLFSDILFALEFFGFADPTNLAEIISYKESVALSEEFMSLPNHQVTEKHRFFAFTEIKYAFRKYHSTCFPNRDIPADIMDYESYSNLMNAMNFVQKQLKILKLLPSNMSEREAILSGIARFQAQNKLSPGFCSLKTLSLLWFKTLDKKCDLIGLCRFGGINVKDSFVPSYEKTLKPIKIISDSTKLENINNFMNTIFGQIRNKSEALRWIMEQTKDSIKSHTDRMDETISIHNSMDERMMEIEKMLITANNQNEDSAEKFAEISKTFDVILNDQKNVHHEFMMVQKRIEESKRGNQILLFLTIILALIVIYRW